MDTKKSPENKTKTLTDLVAWVEKTHTDPHNPSCRRAAVGGTLHSVLVQLAILEELQKLNKLLQGQK